MSKELMEMSGLPNFIYIRGNLTTQPYYKELSNDNYLTKFFVTTAEQKHNSKTGGWYIKKNNFTVNFFGEEYYRYSKTAGADKGMRIEALGNFDLNRSKLKNGQTRYHANIEGTELRLNDDDDVSRLEDFLYPEIAEDEETESDAGNKPMTREEKKDDVLKRFRERHLNTKKHQ